mgnify:CR=1 FL=1
MPDLDNQAFFRATKRLRDGLELKSTDAIILVDRIFLPVVRNNYSWVASYLEETFEGNTGGDNRSLAFSLAGELWEDISRKDLWEDWWQNEAIRLPEQMPSNNECMREFKNKLDELRKRASGRVGYLFRDRARRRTIRTPLLKLLRNGHFCLSDGWEPDFRYYYPKDGEMFPHLPKEKTLDVQAFLFPLPKGRSGKSADIEKSATTSPVRSKAAMLPLQIPGAKELKPLLDQVFQRYPYKIPFSYLVDFLNEGYGLSADMAFAEDEESPSESSRKNTPAWLSGLEDKELLIETVEKIVTEVLPPDGSKKLSSKVETFLHFSIWNGLETVDGETYGLEIYVDRFDVPESTASDHNVKFIRPLLEKYFLKPNLRRGSFKLRSAEAPLLMEMLRRRFLPFKPEFVVWEPFREYEIDSDPR